MTLKVIQNSNAIGFFPLYVAIQQNFFQDHGLTLNPSTPPLMGSGTNMTAAIESDNAELAGGGILTDAFTLSRVDANVKLLGALTTGYFVDIVVSKRFEQQAHLNTLSTLADKVKALVGKKVGDTGPNSGTEALMTYLFRTNGLNVQKDVTLVNVGSTAPAALAALSAGRVDAISFFSPAGQLAEAQNVGDIFISPSHNDIPAMDGQLHGVIYAKQQVINAKPKAIQAFLQGIAQAEDFIHTKPDQATVLLGKYLKINAKDAKLAFAGLLPIIPPNPLICQKAYDTANNFHVKAGLIAIALPYKDMVATDTMQNALSGSACPV
jgi:NitT/TauT family transport system substrate-binding protein